MSRKLPSPRGALKMGWCLTGHHAACRLRARTADGTGWHVCQCQCHENDPEEE